MATVVFFHAHPDDETILTGGTMVQLAAAGHRVVLVVATRGEQGEVPPGFLKAGETLGQRRTKEEEAAARLLGVSRLEFLGYTDSGMMGTASNEEPESFWQADIEEAARRLAAILTDEQVSVLVTYDDHGGYGHPDHIQVHRVGVRAAELAGTPTVYEATIDRDRMIRLIQERAEAGGSAGGDNADEGGAAAGVPDVPEINGDSDFGVPAVQITTRVDVGDQVVTKRQALRCHPSQIAEDTFWLTLPDEEFYLAFCEEHFIRRGARPGIHETALDLGPLP